MIPAFRKNDIIGKWNKKIKEDNKKSD